MSFTNALPVKKSGTKNNEENVGGKLSTGPFIFFSTSLVNVNLSFLLCSNVGKEASHEISPVTTIQTTHTSTIHNQQATSRQFF